MRQVPHGEDLGEGVRDVHDVHSPCPLWPLILRGVWEFLTSLTIFSCDARAAQVVTTSLTSSVRSSQLFKSNLKIAISQPI